MKKETIKYIIQLIVAILTAIGSLRARAVTFARAPRQCSRAAVQMRFARSKVLSPLRYESGKAERNAPAARVKSLPYICT